MGSKIIHTKEGTIIVDENFDESEIDATSMLPENLLVDAVSLNNQDTLIINGEEFKGKIKIFSINENRKTNQKTIKVILIT